MQQKSQLTRNKEWMRLCCERAENKIEERIFKQVQRCVARMAFVKGELELKMWKSALKLKIQVVFPGGCM